MRSIFDKVFNGFLIGLGFTFPLGLAYYFLTFNLVSDIESDYDFDEQSIEIVKHREVIRKENLYVLGQVKNNGEKNAKGVSLNVDLFLKEEFVGQCRTSVSGPLKPNQSRNFEVLCAGGIRNTPFIEHDSYNIYVTTF